MEVEVEVEATASSRSIVLRNILMLLLSDIPILSSCSETMSDAKPKQSSSLSGKPSEIPLFAVSTHALFFPPIQRMIYRIKATRSG